MHFRFQLEEARGEIHLVQVTGETAAAHLPTEKRMACLQSKTAVIFPYAALCDMTPTNRALGAKQRMFLTLC